MYSTKIHYDKQTHHQSLLQQSSFYNTPTLLAGISEKNKCSQQNAGVEVWVADLRIQFCPNSGTLNNISLSYHENTYFQGSL